MNIGMILTAWFLIAVTVVAALIGSGVVSVKIEIVGKDEEEEDEDEDSKDEEN